MKKGAAQGFTIIEVILFLAVTGLIMSVMLVGIANGLNQERYRDASTSLLSYFKGQYSDVVNVSNSRSQYEPCISGGPADAGRGTSDCFIVGKLLTSVVTTDAGGNPLVKSIQSRSVFATTEVTPDDVSGLTPPSDIDILKDSDLIVGDAVDTYTLEWDTALVRPSTETAGPTTFSLLIVRMPTSGVVHTYVTNAAGNSPVEVLNSTTSPAEPTADLKTCIESGGLIKSTQQYTGVIIGANAANSGGVKFVMAGDC